MDYGADNSKKTMALLNISDMLLPVILEFRTSIRWWQNRIGCQIAHVEVGTETGLGHGGGAVAE